MKDWFLRQSPRDRIIVIVVSALTLIVLLYALVWFPLTSRVEQSRQAVSAKQETVQFIEQAGVQLNSASAASGEPSGANGARVQFNEVEFDKLVGVLAELELYGLQVSTMTISRKNQGTVSARFNMERS